MDFTSDIEQVKVIIIRKMYFQNFEFLLGIFKFIENFIFDISSIKILSILDCNNVIDARDMRGGIIESPNFPDPYPHNRNCTWTIQAPRGNNVSATFSHFQVEDPNHRGSCSYDYVELNETRKYGYVSPIELSYVGKRLYSLNN